MEEPNVSTTTTTGKLIPLRTLDEIRTALRTVNVYTIPIPQKSANSITSGLRNFLPSIQHLQHLRRLVTPSYLPPAVLSKIPTPRYPLDTPVLHLLLCAAPDLPLEDLQKSLSSLPEFASSEPPEVTVLPVPYYQPTSAEQAQLWTETYWPTVYKRGNPFGPHPPIVANTAATLKRAGEYIALARAAGEASAEKGAGIPAGAVIVDPATNEIAAVAGDARYCESGREWANPLDHAVMRAVAMVAQKRLPERVEVAPNNPVRAITSLEERYFGKNEDKDGYLCHNMQVYLSHEPCMMCAMALLHSRVGVVVFGERMYRTGALVAEVHPERGGLRQGLFWRPELNWKYLCWQWKDDGSGDGDGKAVEDETSV